MPPRTSWVTLIEIANALAATVAVMLRLHLVFESLVRPATLARYRQDMFQWIARAEVVLSAMLLGSAATIAAQHEATAALLLGVAVVIVGSLTMLEPAATSGAGLTAQSTVVDR